MQALRSLRTRMTDVLPPDRTVSDKPLQRADVEALARQGTPCHLTACDLDETDLSGLDLS
jgi:fluoroquinolone resistance protein